VDRVPAGVGRHFRVGVGGDQAEERGGEDAGPGHTVRVAEDRELLDVAELAHVHFLGELAADRALHVFAGAEETAGQGPPVRVRFLVALPEQDLQLVVAHLQDSGEHFVTKVPGDFVTNVPISAAGGGVRIRHVFDYKSKTWGWEPGVQGLSRAGGEPWEEAQMVATWQRTDTGYTGVEPTEEWAREVRRLLDERDAVLLAHNYQLPEIQDIADHTGDSLALSRIAAKSTASTIVF